MSRAIQVDETQGRYTSRMRDIRAKTCSLPPLGTRMKARSRKQMTVEAAAANFAKLHGRKPSDEQLAGLLAMSVRKLRLIRGD